MTVLAYSAHEEIDASGCCDLRLICCALCSKILGISVKDIDILLRDIDMVEEIKYYYNEFYEFELTDEQARMVIEGWVEG